MSLSDNTNGLEEILEQARNLPDAGGSVADAVRYNEQTLTEEQQAQARSNIGAITGPLYVNLTITSETSGTVDKTNDEIEAAYQAGQSIYCIIQWGGTPILCPLSIRMEGLGVWVFNMAGLMPNTSNATAGYVMVMDGNAQIKMVNMANVGDIPTALPNPNKLTFTGAATGSYDGSAAKTVNIPTVPSSLKNPYALTINGTSYDGSEAVAVVTDPIPSYVRTEAERVAKVVQSRQNANTITFLACSDIHYYSPDNASSNVNADKMHEAVVSMGQAMGLIRERCHIDFAAMLGDMTWDYGETHDEALAEMRFVNTCLSEGFGSLPQLRMEGNHDDGYESGASLTAGEIFANIGAWNDGAVYGDRAAGYCYRDFEDVKLRVITLNSSQYSGSAAQYNAEQVTWLTEVLDLSEKGEDWCSIVVGHHPLDWGRNGGVDPVPVVKSAGGLLGTFHGHIHNFLVGDITGTEVKRIAIPNAGYSRENQYGTSYGVNWKESTTYSKTPGTAQNTSFCVVTIDLEQQKIYADHYGAGYSREIDYTVKSAGPGYTNLVPSSIDPATQAIYGVDYNGDGTPDGYKNDVYGSGVGEGSSPDTDCVLTGLIPYGNGVSTPVYIKGADITTASHCRILGFNGSYECYFQAAAGSSINTYFTVETLGDKYYKVTPISSAITGDTTYLRFSLINPDGGANLIITVGEPIE